MKDFDSEYEVRVPKINPETGERATDPRGNTIYEVITVSRKERFERDRSFRIGGEDFTYRAAVAPESIMRWTKMTGGELPELTEEDALAIYDETILAYLEAGQDEKWRRVRDPETPNPLTLGDLSALVRWLFEQQTARPTPPPSNSSAGSENGTTGTSSTDVSSSPVAAV